MNIIVHLRDSRRVNLVNANPRTVGSAIQHIVDKPSDTTSINGQAMFNNSDVIRIEIEVAA